MYKDDKIGGPSHTEEICKICGKAWTRYRGGSWDWEPKNCVSCEIEATMKDYKWSPPEPKEGEAQVKGLLDTWLKPKPHQINAWAIAKNEARMHVLANKKRIEEKMMKASPQFIENGALYQWCYKEIETSNWVVTNELLTRTQAWHYFDGKYKFSKLDDLL